jgi:hypothetical protein
MMLGIRQRRCVFVGFDEELRSVAADDGEKDSDPAPGISSQTKLIAIEGDGLIDVADAEEWSNSLRIRSWRKHGRSCCGIKS